MECNVMQELIPLYIDHCCSEEGAKLVEEHMETCLYCRKLYENISGRVAVPAPEKFKEINVWGAAVLHTVLLLASIALIIFGVVWELSTPLGWSNGFPAYIIVVPVSGFFLSLVNWFFVRLYKSGRSFSNYSALISIGSTLCGYVLYAFHYEIFSGFFYYLLDSGFGEFIDTYATLLMFLFFLAAVPTMIFGVCAKFFSNIFAMILGKK